VVKIGGVQWRLAIGFSVLVDVDGAFCLFYYFNRLTMAKNFIPLATTYNTPQKLGA
jgi:hypothetical protein